ncbi:OLC1v1000827C1 [Oldenlandia corymbosa var. corymbosa]|uniref:OLC1v1000827C1 n=1 Tax=Oldenlandia corymbosa var. corymbosa TaxID=529605 RepID=A0AAV1D4P8_OLDCO|nr:OLC1v1000827C1 [Oldenlandia corymbosa var. corymbosa]
MAKAYESFLAQKAKEGVITDLLSKTVFFYLLRAAKMTADMNIGKLDDQIHNCVASIMDMPDDIIEDILIRLPLKVIFVCMRVCKHWHHLILSAEFAEMHFAKQEVGLLLNSINDDLGVPKIWYLVDQSEMGTFHECDENLHICPDFPLRLPWRDPGVAAINLGLTDDRFRVVNSYNGFICFTDSNYEPIVVCNPVTKELVHIPAGKEPVRDFVDCGFGFCPTTKELKVIRISYAMVRVSPSPWTTHQNSNKRRWDGMVCRRIAAVHTLGTQSWHDVGYAPSYDGRLTFPTCLHGNLHWFYSYESCRRILSFNFTEESFQKFPTPPSSGSERFDSTKTLMSMGVLNDNLCLSLVDDDHATVWIMEIYGVKESWSKFVKFKMTETGFDIVCQPIDYLKCGSLLMFHYSKFLIIHYNVETNKWECLKVGDSNSKFQAVTLVPSFLSLKEALQGNGERALNIHSRCSGVELQGGAKRIHIAEEDRENSPSGSSALNKESALELVLKLS